MKKTITIVLTALSVNLVGCSDREKEAAAQALEEEMQAVQDFRDKRKAEVEVTKKVFKSFSFVDPAKDNMPSNGQQIIDEIKLKRHYRWKKIREDAEKRGEFIHSNTIIEQDSHTEEYQKEQERLRYAYGGRLPFE